MLDYTHFYRRALPVGDRWEIEWDILISAYNDSDRVQRVFEIVVAKEKHWLVHPEYRYNVGHLSVPDAYNADLRNEAEFILGFWEERLCTGELTGKRVCVDATGFMRPHLMFLLKLLQLRGVCRVDVLYSEPVFL